LQGGQPVSEQQGQRMVLNNSVEILIKSTVSSTISFSFITSSFGLILAFSMGFIHAFVGGYISLVC